MAVSPAKGPLEGIGSLIKGMQLIRAMIKRGEIIIENENELWDLNAQRADFINVSYDKNDEEYIAIIFFSTQIISILFDKNLKPVAVELLNKFPYHE